MCMNREYMYILFKILIPSNRWGRCHTQQQKIHWMKFLEKWKSMSISNYQTNGGTDWISCSHVCEWVNADMCHKQNLKITGSIAFQQMDSLGLVGMYTIWYDMKCAHFHLDIWQWAYYIKSIISHHIGVFCRHRRTHWMSVIHEHEWVNDWTTDFNGEQKTTKRTKEQDVKKK